MGIIRVAVAVICNDQNEILIQQRATNTHQGGLWEFPGGKVERNETVKRALVREINEELNVEIIDFRPLITIAHDYGDRHVSLEVFLVTRWLGEPVSMEQQPLKWVAPALLNEIDMPAADKPIVSAIHLPSSYVITPSSINDPDSILLQLKSLLTSGERLLLYRVKSLSGISHESLQQAILALCDKYNASFIVHEKNLTSVKAHGLHLTEDGLNRFDDEMTRDSRQLLSTSCHSLESLQKAEQLKADFAMLSPVEKTASHPDVVPLGWKAFAAIVRQANIPVYALGGMATEHLETAWSNGAQGVAGISSWWNN